MALASAELALARRYGGSRAVGIALLAVGRCESGTRRLELLRESVSVLEASDGRLEHAGALVELGASMRRANHRHAAREPLARGLGGSGSRELAPRRRSSFAPARR